MKKYTASETDTQRNSLADPGAERRLLSLSISSEPTAWPLPQAEVRGRMRNCVFTTTSWTTMTQEAGQCRSLRTLSPSPSKSP